MNLRMLLPSLADNIYKALETAGITTSQDLLFSQVPQLYQQLPNGVISLRELTELKALVAECASAPATRGDTLFKLEKERENSRETCLSGIDELDALLGGFGQHGVIEIAGDKKCGKTGSFFFFFKDFFFSI
ncbi:hypothetical protein K439DRAFT_1061700 [Ramaria rubella]|nr:hypothetical protein K439DRAFT_1061700 [Ramaria rubella]